MKNGGRNGGGTHGRGHFPFWLIGRANIIFIRWHAKEASEKRAFSCSKGYSARPPIFWAVFSAFPGWFISMATRCKHHDLSSIQNKIQTKKKNKGETELCHVWLRQRHRHSKTHIFYLHLNRNNRNSKIIIPISIGYS